MTGIIKSYNSLPDITKVLILILSIIYVYHFYVFYLWKPVKKKLIFWQVAVYFSVMLSGYYILKMFFKPTYNEIFGTIYMERIVNIFWKPFLKDTIYAPVLAVGTLVFKKYLLHKLSPKKQLKHGPAFTPTKTKETDGITIGTFERDVLPEHIREFTKYSTKPITIPFNRLSRGITILGDMGSGKSRLMRVLQDGIRVRYPKIPILIHDPKGEWLRTYYNPDTDIIFAPFDKRTCSWDLWRDFADHPELKHSVVATAVESHNTDVSNIFWTDSAITLLKDAVSEESIVNAKNILIAKRDARAGDKTFLSYLATAMIGFRDMATVELQAGWNSKTIDEFLKFPGRIFLLNNPDSSSEQHGALTLLLSAFLLKSISLPDVHENELRAAVFIDEALTFHLPADVERAVYSQSRSKGLCIIAGAQRLPDTHQGERGAWSGQAAHIFGMRVTDMPTRTTLSQRLGNMMYDEKQHSTSHGKDSTTKTDSEVQRQHAALSPEDFGRLKNREFVLFHETGVAPGVVITVPGEQNDTIKTFDYNERKDVIEFMRDL